MSIFEKMFRLWNRHTIGCCRGLFVLLFPATISETYGTVYCCFLLLMWMILKTGYEKGWDKEADNEQRAD